MFSSDYRLGGIIITDREMQYRRPGFISMDPPEHDEQRKVVSPIVAPLNLQKKLQLTILWEEILKRFPMFELMGEPERLYSNQIHGITSVPVRIPA